MFSISLKMIFRSWARNKIYFVISMLSLIIGLTCSVLLIGFVANEYNIAHVVKGGGQWYLLQEQNVYYSNEEVMANHTLNGGRAVAIQRSFPEVEDICVCHDDHKQIKKNSGETIPYAAIYAVTPNFADLFQPELLAGDLKETLRDPSGVAVTRSFARISVVDLYYIEFPGNMQAYPHIFDTFPPFDAILRVLLSYAIIVSN